jgi:hypothetical protein
MEKAMNLSFPNTSRTYNAVQRTVRFTGYFKIFEITFDLDQAALMRFSRNSAADEASLLDAFDAHRPQIEAAANTVYWRTRKDYCVLSARDF